VGLLTVPVTIYDLSASGCLIQAFHDRTGLGVVVRLVGREVLAPLPSRLLRLGDLSHAFRPSNFRPASEAVDKKIRPSLSDILNARSSASASVSGERLDGRIGSVAPPRQTTQT
jgi:hypothetical protein